jgi:hypothetical protein
MSVIFCDWTAAWPQFLPWIAPDLASLYLLLQTQVKWLEGIMALFILTIAAMAGGYRKSLRRAHWHREGNSVRYGDVQVDFLYTTVHLLLYALDWTKSEMF